MVRVTSSPARNRSKKRLFKRAKGFFGARKNVLRQTKNAVMKAMAYNYVHRKQKKRTMRSLWIQRINAAARINGLSYSRFICGLVKAEIPMNRKVLADIAFNDPETFKEIANKAKAALK